MKKIVIAAITATLFAAAGVAWATTRTVQLAVDKMTCAVCPITVRKALERVPGVSAVEVSFERKEATVTYDDQRTSVEALIEAATNAGYPARVKGQ